MKIKLLFADCKTRYLALLTVLTLLFTLGSGNAWATYTITFTGSASESTTISTSTTAASITNSSSYVTGNVAAATKAYGATSSGGIKLGTSSAAGSIKINLSASGQVTPTSIVVNCKLYNSSKAATLRVNGSTKQSVGSSYGDLTFNITSAITYIQIDVTKYVWVKSITVNTGSSCGVPTSPTNGSVTASTQPVSWTAPGSAPANGYLVAVGTTSTAPADNVQINNGQAYTWGDHFVSHVAAGTTSFTFGVSQGVVESTQYHWWVRSKCGSSDYSAWVEGTAFTIPSSCSNTVTINKGTSTNCSFSLSPSGAQESCDGVTTTVSITPTTGYGNPSVTQSGASAAPTISGSGNTWTVTYAANTTGTSTINVSCSAKQTTVSFNQNGGTGGQTTTKTATYGSAMPTPITTPTREHYTFEGYYDGSGGTGTKYYNANGTSAKNWDKENSTYTLYAKWTADKYTVTWSVNGTTYQTTSNVPYNTTTSTPADPTPSGDCAGLVFRGWTATENYSDENDPPANMFNTTTPAITGNITFHAVFAEED